MRWLIWLLTLACGYTAYAQSAGDSYYTVATVTATGGTSVTVPLKGLGTSAGNYNAVLMTIESSSTSSTATVDLDLQALMTSDILLGNTITKAVSAPATTPVKTISMVRLTFGGSPVYFGRMQQVTLDAENDNVDSDYTCTVRLLYFHD